MGLSVPEKALGQDDDFMRRPVILADQDRAGLDPTARYLALPKTPEMTAELLVQLSEAQLLKAMRDQPRDQFTRKATGRSATI